MSKFFEALEQAQRDRQARGDAAGHRPDPAPAQTQGQEPLDAAEKSSHPRAAPAPAEIPQGVDEHLVSLLTPAAFEAEQYRALRHIVEQRHRAGGVQVLAVTSAAVGDGKTTTAINLAGALAQAPEARVLLVDADLRRPALGHLLGLEGVHGRCLVNAIVDPAVGLAEVIEDRPPFNLSVIRAGQTPPSPYELLKSPRLGALLDEARSRFDYIVVDAPPLVPVQDCRVIGRWVDGFLLVVQAHRTPRRLVEEALNVIDPARMIGLVFNGDDHALSGYYSGYYAGYTYSPEAVPNGNGAGPWRRTVKRVKTIAAALRPGRPRRRRR
ncbi:MAG: CpsD/CapB family tyrosine-protein kinase [Candidatus Rokubacteria bacterium]|nr:CpsD/CapB family tyrosine-protein kinase [Candidatus Rokubacteria bacterium]